MVDMKPDFACLAVRYALGRQTYVVAEVVDEILRIWDQLPLGIQKVIAKDICYHITYEQDPSDIRAEWLRLTERIGVA